MKMARNEMLGVQAVSVGGAENKKRRMGRAWAWFWIGVGLETGRVGRGYIRVVDPIFFHFFFSFSLLLS